MIVFLVIFLAINALASLIRVIDAAQNRRMSTGEQAFSICFNSVMMVCSIVGLVLCCVHK